MSIETYAHRYNYWYGLISDFVKLTRLDSYGGGMLLQWVSGIENTVSDSEDFTIFLSFEILSSHSGFSQQLPKIKSSL